MEKELIYTLKKIKKKYPFRKVQKIVNDISKLKILVIGDTIVDSYTETEMIGGQTKTPTISVRYIDKKN